jgi:bifunctional non-homologous end joining protein LigD
MIKKHDDHVVEGYDIEEIDQSVLSGRNLAEVAGDAGSAEWKSRPTGRGKLKAAWLADAVAKLDKKKERKALNTEVAGDAEENRPSTPTARKETRNSKGASNAKIPELKSSASSATSALSSSPGPVKRPVPATIHPMLAESVEKPFDGAEWLFEIKWDGYRAVAFIENGKVRLVSRNQNDLTARYPELKDMAKFVQAKTAILDGEVVALDAEGKASFSLMQQRTGFRPGGKRAVGNADVPVLYYAFDLLYLDGYDWRRVPLEERKRKLESLVLTGNAVHYSDHYEERGKALFEIARQRGLEGIVGKRRSSYYEERRSSDWLKIKIRHRIECVIGGFTEPEGSREHFGSLVLGLYDKQARLIHVGQAGSGFNQKSLGEISKVLKKLETSKNPFFGEVEALRKVRWVKPKLVAEIEFAEWTGGTSDGSGPKMRAPVFLGLRDDKDPKECLLSEDKA